MRNPKAKVVIPFRDRGRDPRRTANLEVVLAWWWVNGFDPVVQDDGLDGDAQFNRHRAYNRAVERFPEADVFIFAEADMLIPMDQIIRAVGMAERAPGLVVPFTQYRYLSDGTTDEIRYKYHVLKRDMLAEWWAMSPDNPVSIFCEDAESIRDDKRSIGAVNVVSSRTLGLTGGFTEATSGNWYDDRIIEEGFAFLTAKTRFVDGPAVHMYHLPGWTGDHLTSADREATQRNKQLLTYMRRDIRFGDRKAVRDLLAFRQPTLIETGEME